MQQVYGTVQNRFWSNFAASQDDPSLRYCFERKRFIFCVPDQKMKFYLAENDAESQPMIPGGSLIRKEG